MDAEPFRQDNFLKSRSIYLLGRERVWHQAAKRGKRSDEASGEKKCREGPVFPELWPEEFVLR